MAKAIARRSAAEAFAAYRQRAAQLTRAAAQKQQHTLVAIGSGFGVGFAEARGWNLPTFAGIAPPALYGIVALIASYYIKDRQIRRISESVADGMLTTAGYIGGSKGFTALFSPAAPAAASGVAGWGEEIVETGEF